jgi:hypothetical protein
MPTGSTVTLYLNPDNRFRKDTFGRDLAFVITENGVNVTNSMITTGNGLLWGRSQT